MSVEQLRTVWETLGEIDPLWAVSSDPDRRDGGWDVAELMSTGRHNVAWLLDELAAHGLEFGQHLLDFGCGVGRISCALAERGHLVDGVDISSSMVTLAERYNRVGTRARFTHYPGHRLPFEDATFDGAVSFVVLQHAPPTVQATALVELLRVVRPGGVLAVQVPIAPRVPHALPEHACHARVRLLDTPPRLGTGARAEVEAEVTNLSDRAWSPQADLALGNHWTRGDRTVVFDDGRTPLPAHIPPGGTQRVTLTVTAPDEPGEYTLQLDMVQELVRWFAQAGSEIASTTVDVRAQAPPARPVPDPDRGIEMHPMPDSLVRALVEHCGARVMHALQDNFAGEPWHSRTYLIRR